jgi:hypothetical protein
MGRSLENLRQASALTDHIMHLANSQVMAWHIMACNVRIQIQIYVVPALYQNFVHRLLRLTSESRMSADLPSLASSRDTLLFSTVSGLRSGFES